MRSIWLMAVFISLLIQGGVSAADKGQPLNRVLFTDCNIFDGKADTLEEGRNVLVEGNLIESIGGSSLQAGDGEPLSTARAAR